VRKRCVSVISGIRVWDLKKQCAMKECTVNYVILISEFILLLTYSTAHNPCWITNRFKASQ
jgi:uncharacterized membrane protein